MTTADLTIKEDEGAAAAEANGDAEGEGDASTRESGVDANGEGTPHASVGVALAGIVDWPTCAISACWKSASVICPCCDSCVGGKEGDDWP